MRQATLTPPMTTQIAFNEYLSPDSVERLVDKWHKKKRKTLIFKKFLLLR